MAYSYDKDVDYQALINEAVAKKDYKSAAVLEQQRNAKIEGENIGGVGPTNNYAGNLDDTDYSMMLRQQMESGASTDTVKDTLNKRVNKANSAVNLKQYVNDDLYRSAMNYIASGAGSFSYKEAPEYVSKYQGQIDSLYQQIVNGRYSDFLDTPEYAALDSQYTKQGRKAMQDTVGDVSARTGGLASSYAVTAGQQAYGNQMDALQDAAMQMFENQKSDKLNQFSLLSGLESNDYNKYLGQLDQYRSDRAFDYQVDLDNKSSQEAKADKRASVGDFSSYVDLGIMTQDEANKAQKVWALENPEIALQLYPELSLQLGIAAPAVSYSGSGKAGGNTKSKSDDLGGGVRNNTYVFSQVNEMLSQGWTTTQLQQYLRDQYKSGNINKYTYDQSLNAIYVAAGKQRRNS